MVRPTMMKTIMVVSQVSFQLGHVTLLISRRTSWRNCSGEVRRRGTGASASASITDFFVTSTISTLQLHSSNSGRSGGTRTHDPRFWRPMLYQLSYTPVQGL